MRTPLLASLIGLSLVACAGQIDGGGGGGDDVAPNCGNGIVDEGETCDDSNTTSGDGCSATCTTEAVPRVALTVDKPSVTTDLEVENTILVTATGSMGFSGPVTLAVTATDSTNTAVAGWSTVLGTTTLTLSADGSQTAELKLVVPGNHNTLVANLKVSATSTAAVAETTVAVTANPVVAVTFTQNSGLCVYPQRFINNPYIIKAGRQIMVYNGATTGTMTIHVTAGTGWDHENVGTAQQPGQAYGGTASTVGGEVDFYCHDGGAGTLGDNSTSTTRPFLRVQ